MHRLFCIASNISTLILLLQLTICNAELQWTMVTTKATNCNIPGLKWLLENVSTEYHYPRTYLNFRHRIIEDIKELSKFDLRIERCNDRGYDCEDFQSWKFDRFCRMINWKNQIWSELIDRIKPPFKCPIKKGFYEAQNSSMDMDAIIAWFPGVEKYQWKAVSRAMTVHNDIIYCGIYEARLQRHRRNDIKSSRRPKHNKADAE